MSRAAMLAATGLLTAPWTAADEDKAAGERKLPNFLLVSIDSVRADHLSMYGYPRETTPFLSRLAAERGSVLFERMTAVAPSCHPSHSAMITGLYPQQVGVVYCGEDLIFKPADAEDETDLEAVEEYQQVMVASPTPLVRKKESAIINWLRFPEETRTLAMFLKERGYRTAGLVSIWTLEGRFGYARGFDRFEDDLPEYYGPKRAALLLRDFFGSQRRRPGAATLDLALDFLDQDRGGAPFFMFLHFADAHVPYAAPDNIRFEETPQQRAALEEHWRRRYSPETYTRAMQVMRRAGGEMRLDAYDRSIRYLDSLLEKLFAGLRDRGLLDDTFVIVMADHGESFGQHPYLSQVRARRPFFEHSVYVWEETQHVPLIIHDPGRQRAAERIATAASTIDIVPTVVGRLGLDARAFGVGPLPGIDLLAGPPQRDPRRVYYLTFGRGRPGVLQDTLMDFPRFVGFREGDLKLFVNRERFKRATQGRCFLYDLARDPNEHDNLCEGDIDPARVRRFRHELVSWYNATIEPRRARPPARRGGPR